MAISASKHIKVRMEGTSKVYEVEVFPQDKLSQVTNRLGFPKGKLDVWSPNAPGRLLAPSDPIHNMVNEGMVLSAAPAATVG